MDLMRNRNAVPVLTNLVGLLVGSKPAPLNFNYMTVSAAVLDVGLE